MRAPENLPLNIFPAPSERAEAVIRIFLKRGIRANAPGWRKLIDLNDRSTTDLYYLSEWALRPDEESCPIHGDLGGGNFCPRC